VAQALFVTLEKELPEARAAYVKAGQGKSLENTNSYKNKRGRAAYCGPL
jgi:hypothetical protein